MKLKHKSSVNKPKSANTKNSRHRKLLTLFSAVLAFALISVFGFSFVTGNKQDSGVANTLASTQEPADINSDNKVDIFDLSTLLSNWNQTGTSTSDVNSDSVVNIFDLSVLLSKWGAVVVAPPSGGLKGWQITANNTGLAPFGLSCATLPLYTGSDKPTSGTTISQKRITSSLDLSNGNITIDKSCIQPTSVGEGMPILSTTNFNVCGSNGCAVTPSLVTISNSEIDGSLLTLRLAAYTIGFTGIANLSNNYIHGVGSGIALMNTGNQLSSIIEGNYITDLKGYGDPATTGNHSDGFTVRDFTTSQNASRTLMVRNNRIDCDSPNSTGAFFIQAWAGYIDNVTAEGNLLEGGGYQLILEANASGYGTHMNAVNNRFSGTGYGPGYTTGGPGWASWTENYLNDPTKVDNKGALVTRR